MNVKIIRVMVMLFICGGTLEGCPKLPPLINGIITMSDSTNINSTASFTCYNGYMLKGNIISKCLNNGWDAGVPVCDEIGGKCPKLPSLINGIITLSNSTNTNSTASFTCYNGYMLKGNITSKCRDNGWDSGVPVCAIGSGPVTTQTTATTTNSVTGSRMVTGKKTTTPKPITDCGSFGTFENGTIQLSNSTLIASVAKLICNDDFFINGTCNQSTTSLCLPTGKWSGDLPQCISKHSGVLFYISKNPFIEESFDSILVICKTSNELNYVTIDSLEIRRKLVASSAWETIATLNSTNKPTAVSSSNLANKAIVSGRFTPVPILMLTINESLLACEDATEYQCYISFTGDYGQCYSEINKQFNGFFYPKNVDLEVTRNGTVVASSNSTYAQLHVADTIVLNCTAQIGNNANTMISWETSSYIANGELLPGLPAGTSSKGTSGNYNNCQYTRSATVTHTVDTSDFSEGNVSYSCYVEVVTPDGLTSRNAKANRAFHAEIYSVCPRPSPPAHGSVSITNTTVNSTAYLTCDRGYTRSTGFATCKSSGKWDVPLRCDPVGTVETSVEPDTTTTETVETSVEPDTTTTDCGSLGTFENGTIQLSNSTLIGSVAQFICNDDFFIIGTCDQSTVSLCLPTGKWSDDLPQCISKYSGVLFNISKNPFIEDSFDNILVSCQPSFVLDNFTIDSLEIRRKLVESSAWETIATLNSTNTPTAVSSSNLANKAIVSGSFKFGPVLMLTINESLLACEDATEYQCYVSFTGDYGKCYREINKQFNGFFYAKNVDLEVTMNGTVVESSNSTYPELQVGDTIVLNCTAQIGYNANATISWMSSNIFSSGGLLPDTPTGTLLEESDESSNNCQYTRSATITHTIDTSDFQKSKVSFSCYVEVITPDGLIRRNVSANRAFHADIYAVCHRPSPPAHGYVDVHNVGDPNTTPISSVAFLTCDQGYSRSISTALCRKSGKWDSPLRCNPVGCPKLPSLINGVIALSNTTHNITASFACYHGYMLKGNVTSTCLDKGWDSDVPACDAIACPDPLPPTDGYVSFDTGGKEVNSIVTFYCYPGYKLVGSAETVCLLNATWQDESPSCIVKNCTVPTAPANGYVETTSGSGVNSTASIYCNEGYDLIGNDKIHCAENATWTILDGICDLKDCGNWTYSNDSWKAFSYVTYSKGTTFGSMAICYCNSGYQITTTAKSLAATCNATGTWSRASPPLCVAAKCPSLNVTTNVKVEYSDDEKRSVDSTATFSCTKTGFRINGYTKVTCLPSGQWTGSSPTCEKIEESVTACSHDSDSHGTPWNETQPGAVTTMKCPDKGYTGEISRQCSDKGEWKLPVYNCVRKDIDTIDKQIDAIKENPSEAVHVVTTALDKLIYITKPSTKQTSIYGGEIEKVTSILESIANISEKIEVTDNQAEAFLKTTSNLLDTSNTESWKEISQEQDTTTNTETQNKQTKGATKILDVVSRYSDAVAASLNNSKITNKTVFAPNLVLHVANIEGNQNDISFPRQMETHKFNLTSSFTIPKESLTGLKHVSSVLYKNLSGILPSVTISNGQVVKNQEINSPVVSVKIPNWQNNKKDFHINLKLGHLENQLNGPRCNFWNESLRVWDGTGCTLSSASSPNESICECNHLTNFAILMSPWKQENVDTKAIDIISIVGCSVSLLALVLTIVAHIALWRYVKSDRVVLLINLSVALVISYAIFLGGVDRTENKDACTAVAVLLQYIYLVVFFLMLAEGIDIAVTVLYVFSTKSRLKWLIPCAWLIPAVIVGISLGATQLEGYGNEQFCWLSVKGGLIWAFVAPAFTIILVNFVLLILVLGAAFRTSTLAQKSRTEKTKTGVKCLCVLLPIMGCTWVIGIFYVNESMAWIQYVFAVCNSLQGLVIFLFHCAFNPQIRTAIQRRRKKYRDSNMFSSTSTSNSKQFSMPRASTKSSTYAEIEMNDNMSREDG